ncbi:MAG: sugar MFS transporter [Candidatus Acidiferrales bacterium]
MTIANSNVPSPAVGVPATTDKPAMAMVTTLFFMWGFLTCLNDILIPHLKSIFDLTYGEALLIQFFFFSAYFVFALPSGKLIEWIGYKRAMVGGLFTMGLGALLFVPAASKPSFPLFLVAFAILAAGITLLQVSANPYVAVLGPEKTASSRLNLTQAFNSLGTTVAPWFGSILILSGAPVAIAVIHKMSSAQLQTYRLEQASSVKLPYLGLAIALILLGLVIAKFNLPVIAAVEPHGKVHDSIWKYPRLLLGAVGIFVYVGAEVGIGSLLVNYMSQPDIGHISVQVAARFVSLYWGGAMIGRFIGSAVLQKVRTGTVLGISAVVAFLLVAISIITFGNLAMWTILLIGFFNSTMFPSIFTLSIEGLGPMTGKGSAVLVCAIVGGAVLPELQGILADHIGVHHAFVVPALCYLYIAYFAFRSNKPLHPVAAHS